jgi:alanine dehydrogenase
MKIGVVKEIKDQENRVALTPAGAAALVQAGHTVYVEAGAGLGSGFPDAAYQEAGASMVTSEEAWAAELIVKVKEPLEPEYWHLKGQMVFTYFHLAGVSKALTEALLQTRVTAVAYETVEDRVGKLPLLAPMSAVAGTMAPVIGTYYLARFNHGKGMLLGEVVGQRYGKVVVIGDGVVGRHAAKAADGMGAQVFLVGRHPERAAQWQRDISVHVQYVASSPEAISHHLADADLVVGAVLVPGAKAPYLVTDAMVRRMQPGSVIVDVSIDQGGCVETSRPTSHSDPVYEHYGVIHYCVTNMPGAYPRTSTLALTDATLPYVLQLANGGITALRHDTGFSQGVNTYQGALTSRPVAEALGLMHLYKPFTALAA